MLKVGFIGAGKMGEALIKSMLSIEDMDISILASDIVAERRKCISLANTIRKTFGVNTYTPDVLETIRLK